VESGNPAREAVHSEEEGRSALMRGELECYSDETLTLLQEDISMKRPPSKLVGTPDREGAP